MAANALSRYPLLVAGCIAAGTSLAALQLGRQAPDSQADTLVSTTCSCPEERTV